MSRKPEDLAAPPNERPPHINPRWWYRATWHARQQAVDAYNRQQRPIDKPEPARAPITTRQLTRAEKVATAEFLLEDGTAPADIAAQLDTTVTALEAAARREGRNDIARHFWRARQGNACIDCGAEVTAERCRTCAAQAREARKRPAETVLDEVEELLGLGRTHEEAARKVGKSASALEKSARKYGRGDLARAYARLRSRTRSCKDCGAAVGKSAARCKPCASRVREFAKSTHRRAA